MKRRDLYNLILKKKSFLCVGLDPDPGKLPGHLKDTKDGIFRFCKSIIEKTAPYAVAYKPNLAFFEALGPEGMEVLYRVRQEIPEDVFTIADAKRGDIGNTSKMYATAYFDAFDFDAITVAPYMGEDSVRPFLEFDDKWVILLGLTSNPGSKNFQMKDCGSEKLYQSVINEAQKWGNPDNLMFVIGATHPDYVSEIREMARDHFFLVPGVGAQGGSMEEIAIRGMNDHCGLLVNSSRGIIYAGQGEDFAEKAGAKAKAMAESMNPFIQK